MVPLATVILLTKNAGPRFARTLEAVCSQDLAKPYRVLAIDSGSTDATLETLARFPIQLETIPPECFGFGRTKNQAARIAEGQYLVFLSQDAEPTSRAWLADLLAPFSYPQVAGVYGRQLPWRETPPWERFFLQWTYPPERQLHNRDLAPHDVRFSNVNSAVRREVLLRFSFPENLLMSEDQAWANAALQAGYHVAYEPKAAVYHAHHYSLKGIFRRSFDSGSTLSGILPAAGPVKARGIRYLIQEIRYLISLRRSLSIPYAMLYEFCRVGGYLLGTQESRLPRFLRRISSAYAGESLPHSDTPAPRGL